MHATRKEAKAAGERYFFTGRPCKHGHVCQRFVSNKQCFDCNSERRRFRYHENPGYREAVLSGCKRYVASNRDVVRERRREQGRKKYHSDPSMKERAAQRKRTMRSRIKADPARKKAESTKKYARFKRRYATDLEFRRRINSRQGQRLLRKYQADYRYRLDRCVSSCITQSLKTLGVSSRRRHWEDLVSFTLQELIDHITPQLQPGMTWENYGPVWHIDHAKPKSKCETFAEAWDLSNLQPMFAHENLSKGAKWNGKR